MKFSVNSILLATGLLGLLGATKAQSDARIAVYYQISDAVDIVEFNSCIPLTRQDGLKVDFAVLGSSSKCNIYTANDCSGATAAAPVEVLENGEVIPEYLAAAGPTGSLKCDLPAQKSSQ